MHKFLKLLICIGLPVIVWSLPTQWIALKGLTLVEHRLIAIFILAALCWVLEPFPIFATSVLIIVLELVLVSDKALILLRTPANDQLGNLLSHKEIMATFASPIIMLFLGGFFLAMAATKFQLDLNLARVLLKPFGKHPKYVLLGLMSITALFSMFMSNTATTAMMLAILVPVLQAFEPDDTGKIAFVLGIPFAANIGGIGTPIGTPPNAIALKYLIGNNAISFANWMMFALPYVILMLLLAWLLLLRFYPPKTTRIKIDIQGQFRKNRKAITVYVTFGITILLWLLDFLHGMNAYIVAMIPVAVFLVTQIITAQDMKRMSWDVLWLLSGGIALGLGLEKSGLAERLIAAIPFGNFSPYIIILLATGITFAMANFMSHTATANLLLPIMGALGANLTTLEALGGAKMLILTVTFTASLAMILPISTPPNAMAHSAGGLTSRQMVKPGLIIGLVGIAGIYLMMYLLKWVQFL